MIYATVIVMYVFKQSYNNKKFYSGILNIFYEVLKDVSDSIK